MSTKNANLRKARNKNIQTLANLREEALAIQDDTRSTIQSGFDANQATLDMSQMLSMDALINSNNTVLSDIFSGLEQTTGLLSEQNQAEQFFISQGLSKQEATRRAGLRDSKEDINTFLNNQRQQLEQSRIQQRSDIESGYGAGRQASDQGFSRTGEILDDSLTQGQRTLQSGQSLAEGAIARNTADALNTNLLGTQTAIQELNPAIQAGREASQLYNSYLTDPSAIQNTAIAKFKQDRLNKDLQDSLTAAGLDTSGGAIVNYAMPLQLQLDAQNEQDVFNRLNQQIARGDRASLAIANMINTGTGRDVSLRSDQGRLLSSLYQTTASQQEQSDARNRLTKAGYSDQQASQIVNNLVNQGQNLATITRATDDQIANSIGRAGQMSAGFTYGTGEQLAGDQARGTQQALAATQNMYGNQANLTSQAYNNMANVNQRFGQDQVNLIGNYANANTANQNMLTQGLTDVDAQQQNLLSNIANAEMAAQSNYYNNKPTAMDYIKPIAEVGMMGAGLMTGNPALIGAGVSMNTTGGNRNNYGGYA